MEEQHNHEHNQSENHAHHTHEHRPEKKLYRLTKGRIVAGVAAGLGEYFDVDPLLIRLAFIAVTLMGGSGLILYIILALIIPEKPGDEAGSREDNAKDFIHKVQEGADHIASQIKSRHETRRGGGFRNVIALVLVLIGGLMIVNQFVPFHFWRNEFFWPLILIGVGLIMFFHKKD